MTGIIHRKIVPVLVAVATCVVLVGTGPVGCPKATAAEKQDVLSLLQDSLADLAANRSLSEQCVRDIKSGLDPSDPAYQQAEESYDDARDAYNRFLDLAEETPSESQTRSLRSSNIVENARQATATFLADATTALKPGAATRRIPFNRAVTIPDNLPQTLGKVSPHTRDELLDRFDREVRWSSWSAL